MMKTLPEQALKIPKRPPQLVMRLEQMGSFHQSRLSFMRTLLRKIKRNHWTFDRPVFDINEKGIGIAIYTAKTPQRTYSLICFAHDLPPELRSDRVIAHAWDTTFTMFDGIPDSSDIERLSQNVPKQEAGRITDKELILARANKSVRLFDYVVEQLALGQQPDQETIDKIGYLMRTTAVYGSGKFGAADREILSDRDEFQGPFQTEMLGVFLIRSFTLDLVEHLAYLRSPKMAVKIDPPLRRRFGVGNSTGLGMAPFIVNHPVLLNNWISTREEALSRVRSLQTATIQEIMDFQIIFKRAVQNVDEWQSEHPIQLEKLTSLKKDLSKLAPHIATNRLGKEYPWHNLYLWAEHNLSVEGQEYLVSLMMEPYGRLVDELADNMGADESASFPINGSMPINRFKNIVEDIYAWALKINWKAKDNIARVWYISEEKLEPRLGQRFEEEIEAYEQPLAQGRDVAIMYRDILKWDNQSSLAEFLLYHPEHRHIARRAQIAAQYPYAEIQDNTISSDLLPINLLRCKLSFFGATHFDPRSDRWVRINMFRNAPFPNEINDAQDDNWSYPDLTEHTK